MSPLAHRRERRVGDEGLCDGDDCDYGLIHQCWFGDASFANFVEGCFDRLNQFVARFSSDG